MSFSSRPDLNWPELLRALPPLSGGPIHVRDLARLTAYRGKLLWDGEGRGAAVHAASFLRKREIILESPLLRDPGLFQFILVHELFHFVWQRLGNPLRREFAALLQREQAGRARGELGESSSLRKERLAANDSIRNSQAWRDYVCESFCDTAAWLYAGKRRRAAFTLGRRWRYKRARWFGAVFEEGCAC